MTTIFDVFRRSLQVRRRGEGAYNDDGLWEEGVSTLLSITASVQQTDAEVLQTLPEGYRTKESYTLYTDFKLETSIVDTRNADLVTIDDKDFQVVRVSPWRNLDFATKHYEALVVKVNED